MERGVSNPPNSAPPPPRGRPGCDAGVVVVSRGQTQSDLRIVVNAEKEPTAYALTASAASRTHHRTPISVLLEGYRTTFVGELDDDVDEPDTCHPQCAGIGRRYELQVSQLDRR